MTTDAPRPLPRLARPPRGIINGIAGTVGVAAAVLLCAGYGAYAAARDIVRFYTQP
jgi:hypothetical protein